jgi:hypothetical protein
MDRKIKPKYVSTEKSRGSPRIKTVFLNMLNKFFVTVLFVGVPIPLGVHDN